MKGFGFEWIDGGALVSYGTAPPSPPAAPWYSESWAPPVDAGA